MSARQVAESLVKVSTETERKERVWLKGKKEDLPVYRIPISHLYFNIENGRYADKMLQLKAEHPGADIDPKENTWKRKIYDMLKGEYKGNLNIEGTERDKKAFERLKEDICNREQLKPGIVLADGGVIDGNRRLAVLMSLEDQRFKFFDGVILPSDISAEDRWQIEVGVQLGKDQQLDYSPINKLLKIRQGLQMYKDMPLTTGKTPESMVADALYGVSKEEVSASIELITLIDDYLEFFKHKGQYHLVADNNERFIETLNNLKAAEGKLQPHDMGKLKSFLFITIKEELMDNWEMRKIGNALGGITKARGRKSTPIKKAMDHLITHTTDPKMVRDAYTSEKQHKVVEKSRTICREFLDICAAEKLANQPLTLAKDAHTKLETLKESLKELKKPEDALSIVKELVSMKKLIKSCLSSIKLPKRKHKE